MAWLQASVSRALARQGFALRRHPGTRRQAVLEHQRVDVVLDVGAAKGQYGRELRDFGFRGRIVSFEPMASPYALLAAAAADDDAWSTRRLALGRSEGRTTINVASNSDSSSLLPMAEGHRAAAPTVVYVDTEEIEVGTLDGLADDLLRPGDRAFLKLDTQGFEAEVLDGGPATLDRCVGLELELSFVPLYSGGPLADRMISRLYDEGFRLAGVERGFSDAHGQALQADATFVRTPTAPA